MPAQFLWMTEVLVLIMNLEEVCKVTKTPRFLNGTLLNCIMGSWETTALQTLARIEKEVLSYCDPEWSNLVLPMVLVISCHGNGEVVRERLQ